MEKTGHKGGTDTGAQDHGGGRSLPWQTPKESCDDPLAPDRVAATMANPSYRLAEQDLDFLASDAVRGPRLELDYLKPELGLQGEGIGHTIVVFGSTRIPEPDAARRALAACEEKRDASPGDAEAERAVAIASRIVEKSRFYVMARDFAHRVAMAANHGPGERIAVVTGGGPGLMEAANRGACEDGGRSVGLNISLPHEQYPNPYLTPGLCFQFHYFGMRKLHFLQRARALVAFPGGYGTMDELFETLVLIQTRKIEPLPVILVGRDFWSRAIDFGFLVEEGVIAPADRELFAFADSAEDIFTFIAEWYVRAGKPLFG